MGFEADTSGWLFRHVYWYRSPTLTGLEVDYSSILAIKVNLQSIQT